MAQQFENRLGITAADLDHPGFDRFAQGRLHRASEAALLALLGKDAGGRSAVTFGRLKEVFPDKQLAQFRIAPASFPSRARGAEQIRART